jgi:GGDEF domain-containing protein
VSAPSQSTAAPSDFAASAPAAPAQALTVPRDWVSHTLRHLERWVAWSIALYTAWLAVFAFSGVPAVWLFVLYAGLVGKWAEARPARHQSEMAWRGLALIGGAYLLHTHTSAELGGAVGPFFFWLAITCLFYAFMLKPVWAACILGAALIELAASFLQAASPSSASGFMVHAGFLCIFSLLLAMRFGMEMRAPDETLESGRIDGSTSLYNMAGFAAHGNALLAACRRDKRPLSVAVFDCADLLEVREIYGSRIARKLMQRTVAKLSNLCADQGVAARTGPAEFTVLLPGAGREKALAAIARVLGSPSRIELDAGDSEIVMVPGFLVEAAGPDVSCVTQIHQELRCDLARIEQTEQRRRRYLQRERESHSRPMGLGGAAGASRSERASRSHAASTLPAPLVIS